MDSDVDAEQRYSVLLVCRWVPETAGPYDVLIENFVNNQKEITKCSRQISQSVNQSIRLQLETEKIDL